jgi:plasmid stabilization system protein ParE
MKLVISEDAEKELDDIRSFLRRVNPAFGRRVMKRFRERFAFIRHSPYLTTDRSDLRNGIRTVNSEDYRIYFEVVNKTVNVLHIIHSSRDVTAATFNPADATE